MAKRKRKKKTFDEATFAQVVAKAIGEDRTFMGDSFDQGEPSGYLASSLEELNLILNRDGLGYPLGRIIEVFGGSQSCKTALLYEAIARAQEQGGIGILCPSEGAHDEWLANTYNVDLSRLVIVDDDSGYFTVEGVFEAIHKQLDALEDYDDTPPVVFGIDSIAGLITREDIKAINKGEFDKSRSAQARALIISQNLRRVGARIGRTKMLLFCVNQTRVGKTTPTGQQGKAVSPGGNAIGFYCSVRLRTDMFEKIRAMRGGKKVVVGFKVKGITEKNRLAPPFQEIVFIVHYERGLLSVSEFSDKAKKKDDEKEEPKTKRRRRRKKPE